MARGPRPACGVVRYHLLLDARSRRLPSTSLEAVGVPAYKIASYEVNHLPLIERVARTGKPMLISTGMASLGDIERALDTAAAAGARDLMVMHCAVNYPPRFADLNLRAITTLRSAFQVPIGWSDHTPGHTADVVAVTLGACAVEKHFTLAGTRQAGPSVRARARRARGDGHAIREAEEALGSSVKRVTDAEADLFRLGRRSIVAARDVPAGGELTRDDLAVKRRDSASPWMRWTRSWAGTSPTTWSSDQVLEWDDLVR